MAVNIVSLGSTVPLKDTDNQYLYKQLKNPDLPGGGTVDVVIFLLVARVNISIQT